MYYLFKAPCFCCEAVCNGISTVCKESCKCCHGICSGLKNCWNETVGGIYHKPVGGYVVLTFLTMTGTMALSGVAWASINCDKDDSVTNVKNALAVAIVCGVIHSLCVFWIQIAVLKSITKELDKEQSYIPETERNYDITDNYRTRVRRAIWEVIKYDFVFLFYFFFCPAVFGLGCCGMFIVPQCTGKDAWAAAWAFGGLIFYNGFSGLYFLWLMCGICCGAGTETVKTQVKKVKKGTAKAKSTTASS